MKYDFRFDNGNNLWFTSDIHFSHGNIIKYCSRPYSDVEEMNEKLIENWNNLVKKDDIVFILGDMGFGSTTKITELIERLNGHKYLTPGNHDREHLTNSNFMCCFECVKDIIYIKVGKYPIYLSHFPFLCFDGAYKGMDATWQLYGHCHSKVGSMGMDAQRLIHCFPSQYDVGVDNNDYKPVSFKQVEQIITDQELSLNLIRKC